MERFLYDIVKDVKFEIMRRRQQKTEDQHQSFKPQKNRTRRNKSLETIYPHPNRFYEQMILSNVGK